MSDEQSVMKGLAESIARDISVMATESKWATRFVWAAIAQGALSAAITGFLLLGELGFMNPSVSPFSTARPTCVIERFPIKAFRPDFRTSASVIPALPNGGSMRRARGESLLLMIVESRL